MTTTQGKWVGQSVPRKEDPALLASSGQFIDDLTLPGLAHAAYLRSPYAHAKIVRLDVSRVRAHADVFAVMTGEAVARLTQPQRGRFPLLFSPKVYA